MLKTNKRMSETRFYKMCDAVEDLPNPSEEYFPSVKDLQNHKVEQNIDKFAPYLVWLTSTYKGSRTDKYKEFAKYVNNLIAEYTCVA